MVKRGEIKGGCQASNFVAALQFYGRISGDARRKSEFFLRVDSETAPGLCSPIESSGHTGSSIQDTLKR